MKRKLRRKKKLLLSNRKNKNGGKGRKLSDKIQVCFNEELAKLDVEKKGFIKEIKLITTPLFESSNLGARQRYYFAYALKKLGLSSLEIKKWFDLDHTTILYGLNKLDFERERYPDVSTKLNQIDNMYKQYLRVNYGIMESKTNS